MYILGIDGGASSTRALLGTKNGQLLGLGQACPTNHLISEEGKQRLRAALAQAITMATQQAELVHPYVTSCWLGMTGVFDDLHDVPLVEKSTREIVDCGDVGVSGDIETALAGASLAQPGVIVYAGTGAVAYGIDASRNWTKVGGWGYLGDDKGGAYHMGITALEAVFRAVDGRGQATLLTSRVLAAYEVSTVDALLRALYSTEVVDRARIGSLAPLVTAAANQGDMVAIGIIDTAGQHLAELAATAIRKLPQLQSPPHVYTSGGVFQAGMILRSPFARYLSRSIPSVTVKDPMFPPVVGSYLLALRQCGVVINEALVHTLSSTLGTLTGGRPL